MALLAGGMTKPTAAQETKDPSKVGMKATLVFSLLSAAGVAAVNEREASTSVRGGERELAEVGEAVPVSGGDAQQNSAVGVDGGYPWSLSIPYKTGSCTCAKEAYLDIYKEARNQLKMVPLVAQPPFTDTPIYSVIEREINKLVDFAVCFLHSIDCGCDDGHPNFKVMNQYKVSTYQCCCDVNAMRDIIIDGIRELAKWEMTMDDAMNTVVNTDLVRKRSEFCVLSNIVENVRKNVQEVGEIYTLSANECPLPSGETTCIEFYLLTDDFGGETSAELRKTAAGCDGGDTGLVVEYPQGSFDDATTYENEICDLGLGKYEFTIFDSFGDGICCTFGIGNYQLRDSNGVAFQSGGEFGASETTSFTILPGGSIEDINVETNLAGLGVGGGVDKETYYANLAKEGGSP